MMIIPLTPFALSSGKITEIIVANTIIDKNHDFSYVVNCFANNVIIKTDIIKINEAIPKLNTGVNSLALTCPYECCIS